MKFLIFTCLAFAGVTAMADQAPKEYCQEYEKSIGVASMDQNGVITLQLTACDPETGAIGHGFFTYQKEDPKYQEIFDHVGGLVPGESKSCPPWKY